MSLSPGQILNHRYRIVKLLGQGGFGAVYRAWDINLNIPCALKENTETSEEAARQFAREAMILASLRHPNLPKVTDHFSIPNQGQFLIMEYIEGEDLDEKLRKTGGPVSESLALSWVMQILDALDYLHNQNPPIIHRDIKPANIRITPQGQAVLVDFGIAKVYDPKLKTTLGARAVTPGYSPYEQYGQGSTDSRSDIYALGATLYHLLTDKQPEESNQRIESDLLISPEQLNPSISASTAVAIKRAMQVFSKNRWQSAAEFKSALNFIVPSQSLPYLDIGRIGENIFFPNFLTKYASEQLQTNQPQQLSQIKQIASPMTRHTSPWLWFGVVSALALVVCLIFIISTLSVNSKKTPSITPIIEESITVEFTPTLTIPYIIETTTVEFSPALTSTYSIDLILQATLTAWTTNTISP